MKTLDQNTEGAPKLLPLERRWAIEQALKYLRAFRERRPHSGFVDDFPNDVADIFTRMGIAAKVPLTKLLELITSKEADWEKELSEPSPTYESFADAQTILELTERIRSQGGVAGRRQVYSVPELEENILHILALRRLAHQLPGQRTVLQEKALEALKTVTATQDLRKTVDQLTEKEAPAPTATGARELRAKTP